MHRRRGKATTAWPKKPTDPSDEGRRSGSGSRRRLDASAGWNSPSTSPFISTISNGSESRNCSRQIGVETQARRAPAMRQRGRPLSSVSVPDHDGAPPPRPERPCPTRCSGIEVLVKNEPRHQRGGRAFWRGTAGEASGCVGTGKSPASKPAEPPHRPDRSAPASQGHSDLPIATSRRPASDRRQNARSAAMPTAGSAIEKARKRPQDEPSRPDAWRPVSRRRTKRRIVRAQPSPRILGWLRVRRSGYRCIPDY